MKRGARARGSQPHVREAGVTVRANYVALPFAGWTRSGRRRRKPSGSGVEYLSPVRTRKYGPLAQNRRNGAPQGDALPETIASHAMPEAKRYTGAPCGAPCPSLSGATNRSTRAMRESECARLSLARMEQAPRACCLKIESVTRRATDALSASPPTDYGRATWLRTGPCRPLRSGAPAA